MRRLIVKKYSIRPGILDIIQDFGSELSVHNKIMTQSICVDVVVSQLRLMCKVQTGVGSIIYKFKMSFIIISEELDSTIVFYVYVYIRV